MQCFRREADYWTITYEGRVTRLKDTKGMSYIARLLGHPDDEFHSLDLIGGGQTLGNQAPHAEGLGDAGEMLDSAAKADYLQPLKDLRAGLDEAEQSNDSGRAEKIREEIDLIEGQHSRHRLTRSRPQSSVGIRALPAKRDPRDQSRAGPNCRGRCSASRLLGTTIRTGNFCSYRPDPRFRINWHL